MKVVRLIICTYITFLISQGVAFADTASFVGYSEKFGACARCDQETGLVIDCKEGVSYYHCAFPYPESFLGGTYYIWQTGGSCSLLTEGADCPSGHSTIEEVESLGHP